MTAVPAEPENPLMKAEFHSKLARDHGIVSSYCGEGRAYYDERQLEQCIQTDDCLPKVQLDPIGQQDSHTIDMQARTVNINLMLFHELSQARKPFCSVDRLHINGVKLGKRRGEGTDGQDGTFMRPRSAAASATTTDRAAAANEKGMQHAHGLKVAEQVARMRKLSIVIRRPGKGKIGALSQCRASLLVHGAPHTVQRQEPPISTCPYCGTLLC